MGQGRVTGAFPIYVDARAFSGFLGSRAVGQVTGAWMEAFLFVGLLGPLRCHLIYSTWDSGWRAKVHLSGARWELIEFMGVIS